MIFSIVGIGFITLTRLFRVIRYTKCFGASGRIGPVKWLCHRDSFYREPRFIWCMTYTTCSGVSGSIGPVNLVFIAVRSHRLRLHFVQVSGQNDWRCWFKFRCMIVSMKMNRTKPAADCARLRAIRLIGRIMVASMNREYQGRPVQVVQSAAQLFRGTHAKTRVMRRIYARPSNQAVKVSLHICRTFRPKVMVYV
jgi:hypothetical protein